MKNFDYQENCLPKHSDHECMPNWFEGEYNSFRMSLDGLWKFSYAKNTALAVAGFEADSYSCKDWDEMQIPSPIAAKEYDIPVASYVKYFTLPVNMRNERVCISFQGVESQFSVWLNGHYIGCSENSLEPSEFELTPYLKEGENKLAVRVQKQDGSDFLGIFRSVYLYMVPRTHLWDVQILPELSEDLTEATLTIITTSCGKGEVEVRLLDDKMESVLEGIMAIEEGEEGSDEIQSGIAGMVYQPKLWSAEEPNLYVLQLEVRDEFGDLTEVTSQFVGFRQLEIKDGTMTINGKSLVIKGVKSDCVSVGDKLLDDIVMYKQNNINAVHTSHYLNCPSLYELCDEYGLYLIMDHVSEDFEMKSHHPSVLIPSEAMCMMEDMYELDFKTQDVKYEYQNISVAFTEKSFTVWNHNLFINTDKYVADVILQKDGVAIAKVRLPISVEPLKKEVYDIPQQLLDIMDNFKIASAVYDGEMPEFSLIVSFTLSSDNTWGKREHEVAFGQHVYKKEVAPYSCKEPLEIIERENNILVKGEHFKALFSRLNGGLESYVYGGVDLLKRIPRPNFWCVPSDKDAEKLMQQGYVQWKIASMYASSKSMDMEKLEDSVKFMYTFYMPTTPASSCQVCYHVFGDGTIETTLSYEPVEGFCDMPEFGMLFKLEKEFDTLKWYGFGTQGSKLGIYESKVADNMKDYLQQECGYKCGVRYTELTNYKGRGMRFFGDDLSFRALPYTPHELENAESVDDLPNVNNTVVRVALSDISKKKVFTFCFRGV